MNPPGRHPIQQRQLARTDLLLCPSLPAVLEQGLRKKALRAFACERPAPSMWNNCARASKREKGESHSA